MAVLRTLNPCGGKEKVESIGVVSPLSNNFPKELVVEGYFLVLYTSSLAGRRLRN